MDKPMDVNNLGLFYNKNRSSLDQRPMPWQILWPDYGDEILYRIITFNSDPAPTCDVTFLKIK